MNKQELGIQLAKQGESICLIGEAGTGKTVTSKKIATENTIIVAPSAAAAVNAGGMTCHSTFSLSWGLQTQGDLDRITPEMAHLLGENSPVDRIWFDEVFNLPVDLLDAVDYKLKKIRGNDEPFGGMPVLLSGDPMQCAAFHAPKDMRYIRRHYKTSFAFSAKVWKQLQPETVVLDKIYRNANSDQQELLSAIRTKKSGWQDAIQTINQLATIGEYDPHSDLYICTYKKDARKVNLTEYNKLKTPEFTYLGDGTKGFKSDALPVDKELKLKVGTRVIFVANNYDVGYYNGLAGTITYLTPDCIIVEDDNKREIVVDKYTWKNEKCSVLNGKLKKSTNGKYEQYPLRYGYASTINSSQGLTLNRASLDLGKVAFGAGQLYTGLSRPTDLRNLTLARPIQEDDVRINEDAKEFIERYV